MPFRYDAELFRSQPACTVEVTAEREPIHRGGTVIEVEHLTKRYGPFTAVDDVSFTVEKGEILGFLGPNGAGKTTTMRVLTGYMPATEGRARVAGFDVVEKPIEAKRRTGYLPETPPLYTDMTVRDYLLFCARIKGIARGDRAARVNAVMERTRVADMAEAPVRQAVEGLPAARRPRAGAAQQPRGADPRRADGRAGPEADHRDARTDQGPRRRPHGGAQHAHPARGQPDLPARGHHQQGQGGGGRHARQPHVAAARIRVAVPAGRCAGRRCRRGNRHGGRRDGRHRHRREGRLDGARGGQPDRPGHPAGAGRRRREPRLGPAGAAADAHEPGGRLPDADDDRSRRARAAPATPSAPTTEAA